MHSHILLPLDLTDRNQRALERAGELARASDASVTLLHVVERIEHVPPEELEGFYAELVQTAQQRLAAWAAPLSGSGIAVEVDVRLGNRTRQILDFASDHDCDLIVMATHAVDAAEPGRGFGTISHQVALLAQCDVLLVRP